MTDPVDEIDKLNEKIDSLIDDSRIKTERIDDLEKAIEGIRNVLQYI